MVMQMLTTKQTVIFNCGCIIHVGSTDRRLEKILVLFNVGRSCVRCAGSLSGCDFE